MKTPIFFFILAVSILSFTANASVIGSNSQYYIFDDVYLKTSLVLQDPYPAQPGEYVDLVFMIENEGNDPAKNVVLELVSGYPFSIAESTKEIETINSLQTDENAFLVKYRAYVDKDATDGEYDIELMDKYESLSYRKKTFNVTISDSMTDFDVVLQDIDSSSVTLAVVNIGANDGYSVIVKIPEQENFIASGIISSVIGNLYSGDYTLVNFDITQSGFMNSGMNKTLDAGRPMLNVEVHYTDELGIRRIEEEKVSIPATAPEGTGPASFRQPDRTQSGNGITYILTGLAGIGIVVAFLMYKKRKKHKK